MVQSNALPPVRRNVELSDEILDGRNSIITQQAANRVWGRTGCFVGDPSINTRNRMKKAYVIKIGGNIIDDEEKAFRLSRIIAVLKADAALVLVHGGGKTATKLAEQSGIQQQLVDGRRITDAETLKIVTMVYAGYINKNIVPGYRQMVVMPLV